MSDLGPQHITSLASHTVCPSQPSTPIMPSGQDWKISPWTWVERLYQEASGTSVWETQVQAFWQGQLAEAGAWASLASLNDTPIHELVDGQLVRFRAMVQDQFEPELYLSRFRVRDRASGRVRELTAKYRDVTPCGLKEELLEDETLVNAERQCYYCVSVPGEAPWASQGFRGRSILEPTPSTSQMKPRLKRRNTEDEEMAASGPAEGSEGACKRLKTGEKEPTPTDNPAQSPSLSLNLPIADPRGQAAIIKYYDAPLGLAINDVFEFVGIISLDPSLGLMPSDGSMEQDYFERFTQSERMVQAPPPSLIPRLHVVDRRQMVHANPQMPLSVASSLPDASTEPFLKCRDDLHGLLTQILLGDALAADYLICHLIAKVYKRQDVLVLGKTSVNLMGVPSEHGYPRRLATILQLLLCKSHFLPLSIDNLNQLNFYPKKDHQANRLVSGLLQLSKHTHLILDETSMNQGQLTPEGLKNLTALGHMIKWQRVDYDFSFHQLPFDTDCPCLILSEGRSMLPQDFQVLLKASAPVSAALVDEQFASVSAVLSEDLLTKLRNFISQARFLEWKLTSEVETAIEQDFVHERAGDPQKFTPEDLHHHLVLGKLMSQSYGLGNLDHHMWAKVKDMEKQRKERIAHLPARNRPAQNGMTARQ